MIQETLLALSDPTRREILKILRRSECTAGEIADHFDISAPAISRHLNVLREAELVFSHREGKFVYYALNLDPLELLGGWINDFLRENE
jgi:DNA-binding transcriptional ArsR family regulator